MKRTVLTTAVLPISLFTISTFVTVPSARAGQAPYSSASPAITTASIQRINSRTPSPSPIRSTTSSSASYASENRYQAESCKFCQEYLDCLVTEAIQSYYQHTNLTAYISSNDIIPYIESMCMKQSYAT
jgi:hypothetical protein